MNHSKNTGAIAARLPFFGLGFDMEPVVARAAVIRLEPADISSSRLRFRPGVPVIHGFMLQILDGMCTRGP